MPVQIPAAAPPASSFPAVSAPSLTGRRSGGRLAAAWRAGLAAVLTGGALLLAAPVARAADADADGKSEPTLLNADQVVYDEQAGIVTATGAVELSQGQRTVRADRIVYNRNTKVVVASGQVRMREPSGDFVFTDYAELTDDLRDAFINNVRVLLTDNSRMAGTEGERRDGRLLRVNRGLYSPCELCQEEPTRAPVWQLRASRIVHDKEEKDVRYRHLFLEMFGVPVFYSPYFSHPDPSVDRRSGLLAPSYGSKSKLGTFINNQYYIDIAPDQDATLNATLFTAQSPLVGGEYRKRFENGYLQLNGALTRSELIGLNQVSKGEQNRGFAAVNGRFDLNDTWRVGINAARASDYNFLRRYYGMREDVVTSRAYAEAFDGRNYAAVNAYAFQDMRLGNTTKEPVVAPQMVYSALGQPGELLGGRWSLDAQSLTLQRHKGQSVNRLTLLPGWRREEALPLGLVAWADASALGAFYDYENFDRPDVAGSQRFSGAESRFLPRGSVGVRYPLVRYGESSQQTIEPKLAFSYAPEIRDDDAPNEDSIDATLDSTTLFMSSRYAGYDRLDTGTQATYGLRWAVDGYREGAASIFLGQSYRLNENAGYPVYSGLSKKKSDYVTRVTLQPVNWLDLDYRGRFDSDNERVQVHSMTMSGNYSRVGAYVNFYYRDRSPDMSRNALIHSSYMNMGASVTLAPRWSLGVGHSQAFSSDPGPRITVSSLNYSDECLLFQTVLRRDFTTDTASATSSDEGSTLYFRLVFKNLGEFKSPAFNSLFSSLAGG